MTPAALQLLLVLAPSWDSSEGILQPFQRPSSDAPWEAVGGPLPVSLGERGLAWGRGLRAVCDLPGPCKQEGDRKAPAGFFALGPVFGDAAHQKYALKMPFLAVTDDLECVDDPDSRHYNQFASSSQRDWKSAERMSEQEALYALGVFVQHNTDPVEPGKGSAIFLHIGEGTGTAGCTALEAQALRALVAWLDAAQHPCLVQLPLEAYSHCQPLWNLPPAL